MCLVREMENGKENNFSLGPLFGEGEFSSQIGEKMDLR